MGHQNGNVTIVTCEYVPFPGGIATYANEIAAALLQAGHTVNVVAPEYKEISSDVKDPPSVNRILKHHSISPKSMIDTILYIKKSDPETIILAADIRSLLLIYLLRPFHRRQYRVMVHGSEISKFKKGSPIYKIVRAAYMGAQLVTYNSNATRETFHTGMGVPAHEAISYLGVDKGWFLQPSGPFENTKLAELPKTAQVFCSVGRIEPRKGQLETVRALAQARDKHGLADPIYVVVGRAEDAAYAAAVEAEALQRSLKIIVTGRISAEDIKRLYRISEAHLLLAQSLPGKMEGFGLVLLEAAAQDCPSICTSSGGIPEVVGDTGIILSTDDEDSWARALTIFSKHPDQRELKGGLARNRAEQFTWRSCAAATFPELDL